jgi:hypothetical protein
MADQSAPAKTPDMTPLFFILLTIILAGLGSIRSCEPYSNVPPPPIPGSGDGRYGGGCVRPQPSLAKGGNLSLNQFTVLVGSFGTREQANALAAQLRAMRVNNFTVFHEGKWHVCVGKYWTADRAAESAATLKSLGVPNAVVMPPKPK